MHNSVAEVLLISVAIVASFSLGQHQTCYEQDLTYCARLPSNHYGSSMVAGELTLRCNENQGGKRDQASGPGV